MFLSGLLWLFSAGFALQRGLYSSKRASYEPENARALGKLQTCVSQVAVGLPSSPPFNHVRCGQLREETDRTGDSCPEGVARHGIYPRKTDVLQEVFQDFVEVGPGEISTGSKPEDRQILAKNSLCFLFGF